jgi:hypothetical protein
MFDSLRRQRSEGGKLYEKLDLVENDDNASIITESPSKISRGQLMVIYVLFLAEA